MPDIAEPKTLQEAVIHFSDPARAFAFVVAMRWPDGPICPHCGSKSVGTVATRQIFKCKARECRKQFSPRTGTILEDSPLSFDKWLVAIWLIANAKNGISSYEVGRALGITQKSAWFMLHRIRLAMKAKSLDRKLAGEIEVDESFIGGKARNMHPGTRRAKGRGSVGKAAIMGLLERHGEVRAQVVPDTKKRTLQRIVKANVEPGATVHTDESLSYTGLCESFTHEVINHAEQYVRGNVTTNRIENFWSLTKRTIQGTYVSVEPFHLGAYLDEMTLRFNARKKNDSERFLAVVSAMSGKRLTYRALIGEASEHPTIASLAVGANRSSLAALKFPGPMKGN